MDNSSLKYEFLIQMNTKVFNREVFFSEQKFLAFFKGEEGIQRISNLSKTQSAHPKVKLYYNRWRVLWIIIKAPLNCLLFLFLKCMSLLAKCLGATALSIRCEILAKHCVRELEVLKTQAQFKRNFLAPAFAVHRKDTSDLYLHSPLSLESIKNRLIFDTTFYEEETRIGFYHEKGMCRGSVLWFFHLYLSTQGLFKKPADHLKAICKEFEKGVPREAALLHSLCYTEKRVLHLKLSQVNGTDLSVLASGVYRLSLQTHSFGYIRVGKDLGFLFDPSFGLFQCQTEELSRHLFGSVLTRIDKVEKAVTDEPVQKKLQKKSLAFNRMK